MAGGRTPVPAGAVGRPADALFHETRDGETKRAPRRPCDLFHGKLDGETPHRHNALVKSDSNDAFSTGFLIGLLVGEGHFGGDGRQPHVTLRMHVRHAKIFHWLVELFPESRLYGPYDHGGRAYYQWMARGPFLRETLVPLLRRHLHALDDHAAERFTRMCERYGLVAASDEAPADVG